MNDPYVDTTQRQSKDYSDEQMRAETNHGTCVCGAGYAVSDQYHWRDVEGTIHNRTECYNPMELLWATYSLT